MEGSSLRLLRLLHLADSALPIGGMAHSFGIETLAAEGSLNVERLPQFLEDYVAEAGAMDAAFCRAAHALAGPAFSEEKWLDLNRRRSALQPSRESRAASATLGRRFLELASGLGDWPWLVQALPDAHHSTAFGLAGGALGLDVEATVLAWLHQSVAGLVSACQRLLPLGQRQAGRILWDLKPALARAAKNSDEVFCFTAALDLASMRHPSLATRLFIS